MPDSENRAGRKTQQAHWDAAWQSSVRPRLPSRLSVGTFNITSLLRRHVRPGYRYMEIGCAPGKLLAWVAEILQADVAGLDYSEVGITHCRRLFKALNLDIPLYHQDFFNHTVPGESFDVVTSFGFIEHFDDPAPAVDRHLQLVKPGGVAIITIPNYGGVYGMLQSWCDPENLALHNLGIMNLTALRSLVDSSDFTSVRTYPFGKVDPWLINFEKRLPARLARLISLGVNGIGLLQPMSAAALAPLLVLEVRK
jgi:2-polyprenyl-3-methyl-5-hydroxy-6-metoxy-1,4-benzoquinol methylase